MTTMQQFDRLKTILKQIKPLTGWAPTKPLQLHGDIETLKQDLLSVFDQHLGRWFEALDLYDQEITEHTLRVTALSLELGRRMGLSKKELINIHYGTLLHDIGKLGIPNEIIQKPGKLTKEEYQVVQQHPVYAYQWLSGNGHLEPALDIPLYHHEKWDGSGYPHGLKGEEIPLSARVVAVVDVWDALTSDRPYRKAMSNQQAEVILTAESGTHFDPDIVKTFLRYGFPEMQTIPCSFAYLYA